MFLQVPLFAAAVLLTVFAGNTVAAGKAQTTGRGLASWYGSAHQDHPTASGERYDRAALTAAHRSLPFGTVLRITNPDNGRSVLVRINDRGPFHAGRVLDLSEAAARRIGLLRRGIARVQFEAGSPRIPKGNAAK